MPRRSETTFPITLVKKLLKEGGAHRVGKDACVTVSLEAERYIKSLASDSVANAAHRGARTVHSEDVVFAVSKRVAP
jgi:histone H3/H4